MIAGFYTPTEIFLGNGAINNIQDIITRENLTKALILTDRGISHAGLLEPLKNVIGNHCVCTVFDEVEPDPTDISIKKALQVYKGNEPDFIIAMGGGSSIDTAKAVAILATNGGEMIDYKGVGKVKQQIKPMVAIPTTAGTGSEVTALTVITDTKNTIKYSVGGKNVVAKWAIVDPELTTTLPPHITAATGIDALVHAIEAYTSKLAQPLTDALAMEAIRLIGANLRGAVYQGNNMDVRKSMMEASLMAGIAFNNARLGLCHVLCNPLGAHYNIPHGVANALLLPSVTRFNLPAQIDKYAMIAELLGESVEGCSANEAAVKGFKAMKQLIIDVGLPPTLADVHVDKGLIPQMVDECIDNPLIQINPRLANRDQLIRIYEDAYEGV